LKESRPATIKRRSVWELVNRMKGKLTCEFN
jgi:hypothetical protein